MRLRWYWHITLRRDSLRGFGSDDRDYLIDSLLFYFILLRRYDSFTFYLFARYNHRTSCIFSHRCFKFNNLVTILYWWFELCNVDDRILIFLFYFFLRLCFRFWCFCWLCSDYFFCAFNGSQLILWGIRLRLNIIFFHLMSPLIE